MTMARADLIAAFSRWMGATAALSAVAARRGGLLVVNYHRIGLPEGCPFDQGVFDASPDGFEQQVAWLKRRFCLISLGEALDWIRRPRAFSQTLALITFDDGYRDNFDTAAPILRSLSVSAVFFLTTSFVGSKSLPWWDQIAWIVRNCPLDFLELHYPRRASFSLRQESREAAIRTLLRTYKDPSTPDPDAFLAALREAAGVTPPQADLFMSWDQARLLLSQGMDIGSHTHTHRILSRLGEVEQLGELTISRDLIRRHLGQTPLAVAYPVGSPTSFTPLTVRLTREAGYQAAFSYSGGINRSGSSDNFLLMRNGVTFGMPFDTFRLRLTLTALSRHRSG